MRVLFKAEPGSSRGVAVFGRSGRFKFDISALSVGLTLALLAAPPLPAAEEADPAEVAIGERLFLETRFAYSAAATTGQPDPVTQQLATTGDPIPGPFAGGTINCRSCHLVDEAAATPGGGMRTYADFARRSPVTRREDGGQTSVRNSMQMVDVVMAQQGGALLHYDGEFTTTADLVRATLTGRNFGWLPGEQRKAITHIARIIREDDGTGELAREFGGSYRRVLTGTAADLPAGLRLPAEYRIDVDRVSDEAVVDGVARLISAYVDQIGFERDPQGHYQASPYDAFLKANHLPAAPATNESPLDYSRRLRAAVNKLRQPRFIPSTARQFRSHNQAFEFGPRELRGLKIFLAEIEAPAANNSVGNCIACHAAPTFSDFGFHNTGISQAEYDTLHGVGRFAELKIPKLKQRLREHDHWLPATAIHPAASGRYRAAASADKPGHTDLGLWNVFANPDMPKPQARIRARLCEADPDLKRKTRCLDDKLLPHTAARFRTPILRDLGHSQPYMHNGRFDTLEQVMAFYLQVAEQQRQGTLRNGAPELAVIRINGDDLAALSAFLSAE